MGVLTTCKASLGNPMYRAWGEGRSRDQSYPGPTKPRRKPRTAHWLPKPQTREGSRVDGEEGKCPKQTQPSQPLTFFALGDEELELEIERRTEAVKKDGDGKAKLSSSAVAAVCELISCRWWHLHQYISQSCVFLPSFPFRLIPSG